MLKWKVNQRPSSVEFIETPDGRFTPLGLSEQSERLVVDADQHQDHVNSGRATAASKLPVQEPLGKLSDQLTTAERQCLPTCLLSFP
jgi:hypothetical protein